jgi:hypothetical protein
VHPGCAQGYFGLSDLSVLGPRLRQASPRLDPALDDATLGAILSGDPGATPSTE